ncbi:hypothetical protein HPULCUR_011232 [Helicostylum pulchrum]|uniref:Cullin family profile domain-containing protein n=1 Tax=Helicostylum pulchrum TaxID=562976 RepID=A0ABP9YFJ7_9FUNG
MPKPSQKVVKKRKFVSAVDPSQHKMDRFLSSSSLERKDDPMVVDSPTVVPDLKEKSNVLGTVRQQSLTPCIVIANAKPSRAQQLPETFFKSSWETQQKLLKEIFEDTQSIQINYITASKSLESLCRYGKSKEIFDKLKIEIENHVERMKKDLLSKPLNDNILGRLKHCWNTFCSQLAIIRNVFMELDRSFILPNTKFTSIIQLGKHIFSTTIMDSTKFRNVVVAEVLNLIKLDRDSNQDVDIKLIQSILQMLIELSYYTSEFETKFLSSTNTYYAEESNTLINKLDTPSYIQHVYQRRSQEINDRIKLYLDVHTKQALANVVTNQLVYSKTELIIKKGFDQMMQDNQMKPLKIFYDLLVSNPKISLLRHAFGEYIKTRGVSLIKNPLVDTNMVVEVLKFKTTLDNILKNCFDNDKLFQNALKESFEYFMNTRGNKPAEMIARFVDSKLKISAKKRVADTDISTLDQVLELFRYIQGKDAFETYYKRFLAKRLLMDRSVSTELENHVLEKLKAECGHEFTKNLDSMMSDIKLSSELDEAFLQYQVSVPRMPLSVKVVSQAIWPTFPTSEIVLPKKMLQSQAIYTKFYTLKNNGKKLIWQNLLSSCVVTGHFLQGSKEITVSVSQAAILILFNQRQTMTLNEIAKATNLGTKELSRLLTSVSTGNFNFLTQVASNTETKSWAYNPNFRSSSNRLRVPAAVVDQAVEEQKVEEKVFKNRQHQIDAAIVRIMKSKKTAAHDILVTEVVKQLNYPAEANDVKKRIESLIEKYYLTRDTNDSSVYIYQS